MNGPKIIFTIPIFEGIPVTETVTNSWMIMGAIFIFCFFVTRRLQIQPKGVQTLLEKFVQAVYRMVEQTMGPDKLGFAPYIGTLFTFSLLCSLSSLVGMRPPTADFNTTLGWALVTFMLVQVNAIRKKGVRGWLHGFIEPLPLMLPLNIISEVANPISLSFRHFGNIAAGMAITSLIYGGLASLTAMIFEGLQIPILQVGIPAFLSIYFDLLTSGLQAFIFCMLTMVFIAMAMD